MSVGQTSILVVDTETAVRDIVAESLAGTGAVNIALHGDGKAAMRAAEATLPSLVVLNVDVPQGWPLCRQLRERFPDVPVVLLSSKVTQETFENHMKLPTRADAYLRLPEDEERLRLTLTYYLNHPRIEPDVDEPKNVSDGTSGRLLDMADTLKQAKREIKQLQARVKTAGDTNEGLHRTSAEQARVLETVRRESEALAAERDALVEKTRRLDATRSVDGAAPAGQSSEALTTLQNRNQKLEQKVATDKAVADNIREELEARIRSLTSERDSVLATAGIAAQSGGDERLTALSEDAQLARAQVAAKEEARLATECALMASQGEVTSLTEQLATAQTEVAEALDKAEKAEHAWSGVNARAEGAMTALQTARESVERLTGEKADSESALNTSRKLMKEYGQEVARKKELIADLETRLRTVSGGAKQQTSTVEAITAEREAEKARAEAAEAARDAAIARVGTLQAMGQQFEAQVAENAVLDGRAAQAEAEVRDYETAIKAQAAALNSAKSRVVELKASVSKHAEALEAKDAALWAVVEARDAEHRATIEAKDAEAAKTTARLAEVANQAGTYIRMERASVTMAHEAEQYATTLRLKIDEANARSAVFAARIEDLTTLRQRLLNHHAVMQQALEEISGPADVPGLPEVPDMPDFRAIFEAARAETVTTDGAPQTPKAPALPPDLPPPTPSD
ncbi:MAG: CheY-like chemotaxis protein [Myxococcota bacterium]